MQLPFAEIVKLALSNTKKQAFQDFSDLAVRLDTRTESYVAT